MAYKIRNLYTSRDARAAFASLGVSYRFSRLCTVFPLGMVRLMCGAAVSAGRRFAAYLIQKWGDLIGLFFLLLHTVGMTAGVSCTSGERSMFLRLLVRNFFSLVFLGRP